MLGCCPLFCFLFWTGFVPPPGQRHRVDLKDRQIAFPAWITSCVFICHVVILLCQAHLIVCLLFRKNGFLENGALWVTEKVKWVLIGAMEDSWHLGVMSSKFTYTSEENFINSLLHLTGSLLSQCLLIKTDLHFTGWLRKRTERQQFRILSFGAQRRGLIFSRKWWEEDRRLDWSPKVPSAANLNIHLLYQFTQQQESQGTSLFLKFSQPEGFRAR